MLQTVEFQLNGTAFELKEFSFRQARAHTAEGKEMIDKHATPDEWYDRALKTVAAQIVGDDWNIDKLQDELSKGSIDALYNKVLEISGLRIPEPGEVKAA